MHQPAVEPLGGLGPVAGVEDQPQVLGGDPRLADLVIVVVPCIKAGEQTFPRPLGQVLRRSAQDAADPVQRVVAAPPSLSTLGETPARP